jgi:lysylphosphatidylglycerol synthetase-like protein (DUF2156 family)
MINAVNRYGDLQGLITDFQDARRAYLIEISSDTPMYSHNRKFRKGWLSREATVRRVAIDLMDKAPPLPPIVVLPKAAEPVAVSAPSRASIAAKSPSFWSAVVAMIALIVNAFQAAADWVGNLIITLFDILPDAIGAGTTATSALSSLGGIIGRELKTVIAVAGITAILTFMWRHVDLKHAVRKREAEQGEVIK